MAGGRVRVRGGWRRVKGEEEEGGKKGGRGTGGGYLIEIGRSAHIQQEPES